MNASSSVAFVLVLFLVSFPTVASHSGSASSTDVRPAPARSGPRAVDPSVANFSASLSRLVYLVGTAGGAILALVWTRVALSWFSNDVTKKVQAKDRARDALVGTLIFTAALSGLIWGLAQWVLTGH